MKCFIAAWSFRAGSGTWAETGAIGRSGPDDQAECADLLQTLCMKPVLGTLLFGLAVLSSPGVAAPPKSTPLRVSLFSDEMRFALPAGFVQGTNRRNGTHVLIEYVPRGETLATWTQLVTIQAYRGLGRSPASTAQIARQAFYPAACRDGASYHDLGERPIAHGLTRTLVVNGCASLPTGAYPKAMAGAGEQDFIVVFRTAESIYTLNYARRGAPYRNSGLSVPLSESEALVREVFGDVSLRGTYDNR